MNLFDIFIEVQKKYTVSQIAAALNVVNGTVNRWNTNKSVPEAYAFDLMKLNGMEIDYSQFSAKDKDQFFTPKELASKYVELVYDKLSELNIDVSEYIFVEPSAGNGVFLDFLPTNTLAFDIEPRDNRVVRQDFLDWQPDLSKKYIVIGNPPFGLRGQKALQFINKAFTFADFVCFILPPLFNSDGRGSPKKRISHYLIFSEDISSQNYSYPDNTLTNINTIFQIWTKLNLGIELNENYIPVGYQVYSLSDGGSPSTTRNKDKLYICDYYLPSTVFGKDKMKIYHDFEELPQRRGYGIIVDDKNISKIIEQIDWAQEAFYSTNNAINLRTSLIVKAIENKKSLT